jgi:uncharacterized protein YdeI (YjbR/CyaY-like superfamily)
MSDKAHHTFETPEQLYAWLQAHHASETELWVRIHKKGTGLPSVTWDDCVVAAIAWGWIDAVRKSLDETSFLQRLAPRRGRSNWSQKNVQHAERLIAQGRMQAAGLAHVEAARSDGRWATAYAGSATMVIPEDFLAALQQDPDAHAFYATAEAAAVVHHLLPAHQRQAAGDAAEAHDGVAGQAGARRKSLRGLANE